MSAPVILRILTAVPGEKGKMTVYVGRSEEKEDGSWGFESVVLTTDNNQSAFRIADVWQAEIPTKKRWGA